MTNQTTPASFFAENGYVVLRSFLPDPLLSVVYGYALKMRAMGKMDDGDEHVPGTPCLYGDPLMDTLLDCVVPDLQRGLELALFQTYSYFRVYQHGDKLVRHVDRGASEIAMTLTLGYEAAETWPIFVESQDQSHKVMLNPGDAMVYRGCERPHWRGVFEGQHHAQVFMFFVDQNGPNAGIKFDGWGVRTSEASA